MRMCVWGGWGERGRGWGWGGVGWGSGVGRGSTPPTWPRSRRSSPVTPLSSLVARRPALVARRSSPVAPLSSLVARRPSPRTRRGERTSPLYSPMSSPRLTGSATKRPHPATVEAPTSVCFFMFRCSGTLRQWIWSAGVCRSTVCPQPETAGPKDRRRREHDTPAHCLGQQWGPLTAAGPAHRAQVRVALALCRKARALPRVAQALAAAAREAVLACTPQ